MRSSCSRQPSLALACGLSAQQTISPLRIIHLLSPADGDGDLDILLANNRIQQSYSSDGSRYAHLYSGVNDVTNYIPTISSHHVHGGLDHYAISTYRVELYRNEQFGASWSKVTGTSIEAADPSMTAITMALNNAVSFGDIDGQHAPTLSHTTSSPHHPFSNITSPPIPHCSLDGQATVTSTYSLAPPPARADMLSAASRTRCTCSSTARASAFARATHSRASTYPDGRAARRTSITRTNAQSI